MNPPSADPTVNPPTPPPQAAVWLGGRELWRAFLGTALASGFFFWAGWRVAAWMLAGFALFFFIGAVTTRCARSGTAPPAGPRPLVRRTSEGEP